MHTPHAPAAAVQLHKIALPARGHQSAAGHDVSGVGVQCCSVMVRACGVGVSVGGGRYGCAGRTVPKKRGRLQSAYLLQSNSALLPLLFPPFPLTHSQTTCPQNCLVERLTPTAALFMAWQGQGRERGAADGEAQRRRGAAGVWHLRVGHGRGHAPAGEQGLVFTPWDCFRGAPRVWHLCVGHKRGHALLVRGLLCIGLFGVPMLLLCWVVCALLASDACTGERARLAVLL